MLVKNVSEDLTSELSKKNWLAYWQYFSANKSEYCAEVNCLNHHDYGALVTPNPTHYEETYVVPLCKMHSDNDKEQINIAENAEMIPANMTL